MPEPCPLQPYEGSKRGVRSEGSSPWEYVKQQVFLGSDAFVEAMQRKVPRHRDLREVPQAKPRPLPQSLPEFERANPDRDQAIRAAYASGGYTMREIGDYFGLHQSRISKIIRPARQLGTRTKA